MAHQIFEGIKLGRYEFKYLIPEHRRVALLARVASRLRPDPHGQGRWGTYQVHSIYFDSPTLAVYREKMDSLPYRNKVRVRSYGSEDGPFQLEIKQRRHAHIFKYKLPLKGTLLQRVLRGQPLAGEGDSPAVTHYNRQVAMWGIRPVALVSYTRNAFVSRLPGNLRVTFDTGVSVKRYAKTRGQDETYEVQHPYPILNGRMAVAEVKFERLMPRWLMQLIRDGSMANRSVSKYCLGVQRLQQTGRLHVAGLN